MNSENDKNIYVLSLVDTSTDISELNNGWDETETEPETEIDLDEFFKTQNLYNTTLDEISEIEKIDPISKLVEPTTGLLKESYNEGDDHKTLNTDGNQKLYDEIIDDMFKDEGEATGAEFEGYEDGDLIASPVTGKVLEVGTHERMNLYTNEMEEVGYIVIEALKEGGVPSTATSDKTEKDRKNYNGDEYYNYEAWEALNLFYDEYKDVCEGYTIMIDGIDVDLSVKDGEGEDAKEGDYEKNEVHALYNTKEQKDREDKEQAKEDAPFIVRYGVEGYPEKGYVAPDGAEGYYIKEGKYIGKAVENGVTVETPSEGALPEGTDSEPETNPEQPPTPDLDLNSTEEKLTYTYYDYNGPSDYIRIVIKDTDYAIVDNVDDFFEIPEPELQLGDIDMLAKFICAYENGALYAYLYGGVDNYDSNRYVNQYITRDKKYFLCRGDHYNDPTNRNFGFGVCHHSFGKYMQQGYYEQVGVDIDSGAYYEEGTKLEVEKVEKVRQMIINDMIETVKARCGDELWSRLKPTQQHCLVDIAYQYGPYGAPVTEIINKKGKLPSDYWLWSKWGARGTGRKILWNDGKYTDASGNEIK